MSRKLRRHRRKLIIIGTFVLVVGLLYAFRRPILVRIGTYLVIHDELAPWNKAIVRTSLGKGPYYLLFHGASQADLIAVMPSDWQEAEYDIELYKEGYAPKVLFIGDEPTELAVSKSDRFQVVKKPWKEVAKGIALAQGVSAIENYGLRVEF